MFKYLHFVCMSEELEDRLNEAGKDGWRLHTCDPVITADGQIMLVVVMDMTIVFEEEEQHHEDDDGIAAMAAKG